MKTRHTTDFHTCMLRLFYVRQKSPSMNKTVLLTTNIYDTLKYIFLSKQGQRTERFGYYWTSILLKGLKLHRCSKDAPSHPMGFRSFSLQKFNVLRKYVLKIFRAKDRRQNQTGKIILQILSYK